MAVKIVDYAGPQGRGTYVHTCYRPTECCEAGGVGDACGGPTEFTRDVEEVA